LCARFGQANLRRRGEHDANSGRGIKDKSIEVYSELVIGLAHDTPFTEIAARCARFDAATDPKDLKRRQRRLEPGGPRTPLLPTVPEIVRTT